MEGAAASIASAIQDAEQMAGETVRSVLANVSGGLLGSDTLQVEVAIAGHEVGDSDLKRALAQGRAGYQQPDRELIHSVYGVGYKLDWEP